MTRRRKRLFALARNALRERERDSKQIKIVFLLPPLPWDIRYCQSPPLVVEDGRHLHSAPLRMASSPFMARRRQISPHLSRNNPLYSTTKVVVVYLVLEGAKRPRRKGAKCLRGEDEISAGKERNLIEGPTPPTPPTRQVQTSPSSQPESRERTARVRKTKW